MIGAGKRYTQTGADEQKQKERAIVRGIGQGILSVLAFGSTLLSFVSFGVSWTTVVVSGLAVLLALSLLANLLSYLNSKKFRAHSRHIAFLAPSSGNEAFYAGMLAGLVRGATLAFGGNYLILPSLPTESFEKVSLWSLFSNLEAHQVEIDAIVFIPDDPDEHFDDLVGFHEQRGEIPLVLVDVNFDPNRYDERTRPRLPSFVGGNELIGGSIASELVIEAVPTPPANPKVIVINGGVSPWERQRADSFRSHLLAAWPCARFIESPALNYSRAKSRDWALSALPSQADADRVIGVTAVFACDDEMAIGVRIAIERLGVQGYTFLPTPQIVGYDGIAEMRVYLDLHDRYMAGTVDVRVEDQASEVIMLVQQLKRSGERSGKTVLIEPRPLRRVR